MRRPFGLFCPIQIGMARICPLHIQLPAAGTVAVALLAAGAVADAGKAPGRGIAGPADMELAEWHKHRESVEDQLAVYLQTLAVAFRPMPSEPPVAQRQQTNRVAVQLPVSTR